MQRKLSSLTSSYRFNLLNLALNIRAFKFNYCTKHIKEDFDMFDDSLDKDISTSMNTPSFLTDTPINIDSKSNNFSDETEEYDPLQVNLVRITHAPVRYEMATSTNIYRWKTLAKYARRIIGPMRCFANEIKFRTGVHIDVDPIHPDKLTDHSYDSVDDVEIYAYFFGSEAAVKQTQTLIKKVIEHEPALVRVGIYRKGPHNTVEWLTLRRINRDIRSSDIPPISLKTPGKHTMLFESNEEAAIRSLWEETGISIQESDLTYTNTLAENLAIHHWRCPVHYYIARLPDDAEIEGPQTSTSSYMIGWDSTLLKQSVDPIDKVWGAVADPNTGCAWLSTSQMDELQLPLRGENYIQKRYFPSPESSHYKIIVEQNS